jgi:Fe-S-cluster containining protein
MRFYADFSQVDNLHIDPAVHYDCVQCGRGCNVGWDIPVEASVVTSLTGQNLTLRVIQDKGDPFRVDGEQHFIKSSTDCPSCRFLESGNLCGIHRELGLRAKPKTCQVFPFIITDTPDGYFVGTTFYCTAVRQNHGRNLTDHRADVVEMLQDGAPTNRVGSKLEIYAGYLTSWYTYVKFETALISRAQQLGYHEALSRAAVGLSAFMAEAPPLEQTELYPPYQLLDLWSHRLMPEGPVAEFMEPFVDMQMGDFFKLDMSEDEQWEMVDAAVFGGGYLELPEYAWEGTFEQMSQAARASVGARFDGEIERYLAHLVFRKALVNHPTLLSSCLQLQMLKPFLQRMTMLLARKAGRNQAELSDYFQALELAEQSLVTHSRQRRVIHEIGADTLVSVLRKRAKTLAAV